MSLEFRSSVSHDTCPQDTLTGGFPAPPPHYFIVLANAILTVERTGWVGPGRGSWRRFCGAWGNHIPYFLCLHHPKTSPNNNHGFLPPWGGGKGPQFPRFPLTPSSFSSTPPPSASTSPPASPTLWGWGTGVGAHLLGDMGQITIPSPLLSRNLGQHPHLPLRGDWVDGGSA